MKVLHIEERFYPGMGYQINFFARYHRSDYDFSILTSDSSRLWRASNGSEDLKQVDEDFQREHKVSILRLATAMDRKSKQNLWLKGLLKNIRRINPDILFVHTIESYSALRIILSKKILSNYTIFFDTHTLYNQFQGGLKFKAFLWFFRNVVSKRLVRYDAKVFATVPENRMILEKEYGIPADRILYSPIGTDLGIFKYDQEAGYGLREKERIKEDGTVLLYTGKINNRKNPHLVLEAVLLIQNKIKLPLHIYFVGAVDIGYFEGRMKVDFLNENVHVKFIPAVPVWELSQWYSMADFAVFPNENTLSALDAQACKLPVIMQEDMTNSERLAHGGLTFDQGNIKDLAEKILTMIQNPDQRKQIGIEGEKFIKAAYDYREIVKNMETTIFSN